MMIFIFLRISVYSYSYSSSQAPRKNISKIFSRGLRFTCAIDHRPKDLYLAVLSHIFHHYGTALAKGASTIL